MMSLFLGKEEISTHLFLGLLPQISKFSGLVRTNKTPSLLFVPQCYNHLQKYLQHCTVVGLNWPAHDLVFVITLLPLSKLQVIQDLSQTMEEQLWMKGREGVSVIFHICVTSCDLWLKRLFFRQCLIIFATGFSRMQNLHCLVIKSSCIHVWPYIIRDVVKEKLSRLSLSYLSSWLFYSVARLKLLHVFVSQSSLSWW